MDDDNSCHGSGVDGGMKEKESVHTELVNDLQCSKVGMCEKRTTFTCEKDLRKYRSMAKKDKDTAK